MKLFVSSISYHTCPNSEPWILLILYHSIKVYKRKKNDITDLNSKNPCRAPKRIDVPAPTTPTGAIRALQESHKSITMASITSSAVFGKVSALKASKSVKRCVRCVRCVFVSLARRRSGTA